MSLKKIAKLLANKKVKRIAWMLISHPKFIKMLKNNIIKKIKRRKYISKTIIQHAY